MSANRAIIIWQQQQLFSSKQWRVAQKPAMANKFDHNQWAHKWNCCIDNWLACSDAHCDWVVLIWKKNLNDPCLLNILLGECVALKRPTYLLFITAGKANIPQLMIANTKSKPKVKQWPLKIGVEILFLNIKKYVDFEAEFVIIINGSASLILFRCHVANTIGY